MATVRVLGSEVHQSHRLGSVKDVLVALAPVGVTVLPVAMQMLKSPAITRRSLLRPVIKTERSLRAAAHSFEGVTPGPREHSRAIDPGLCAT